MSTVAYQCPCCGAPLAYNAQNGQLECSACSNTYELDAIEMLNAPQEKGGVAFDRPQETFSHEEAAEMQSFICKSCGAELMTEETTTATECPYCGSPTILPDRISGGVKPEKVIPFTVTKEEAQKLFEDYFQGKRLLPNVFLESRNRICEMRKLYVPYWLFDCNAQASVVYDAEKRRVSRQGEWEVEQIRHYLVRRSGRLSFENIPVDGSVKLDNKITESLEPYDLSAAVDFQPAVLAGALADHADVNAEDCEGRAAERVETSICDALRGTVEGYNRVNERNRCVSSQGGKVTPVLMPVWLITTEKEGKIYTFAINGQTGKLTCDVPADKKKSLLWGGGVFAGVMGLAAIVLALLEMLESGPLLVAVLLSLVIAFVVVSTMTAKLKQAHHESAAENYVVDNSFEVWGCHDHFLYETTNRRKIQSKS